MWEMERGREKEKEGGREGETEREKGRQAGKVFEFEWLVVGWLIIVWGSFFILRGLGWLASYYFISFHRPLFFPHFPSR
jgi:hypothetical protein